MRMGLATHQIPCQELSKCQLSFLRCHDACLLRTQFSHRQRCGLKLAVFLDGLRAGLLASAGYLLISPDYLPSSHLPTHFLQDLFSVAEETPIHFARFPLAHVVFFPGSSFQLPLSPQCPLPPAKAGPGGSVLGSCIALPLSTMTPHRNCWFSPNLTAHWELLKGRDWAGLVGAWPVQGSMGWCSAVPILKLVISSLPCVL